MEIRSRAEVLQDTIAILEEYFADQDLEAVISEATRFLGDLGCESLEVVIIANSTQARYGRPFPFNDFFAAVGEREDGDATVGEWVDFVCSHLERGLGD
ncbi:MAG: hypothetical protein AB1791_00555 [Chloroflexota bacterium]